MSSQSNAPLNLGHESLPNQWPGDLPVITNTRRILRKDADIPLFGDDVWDLNALLAERGRKVFHIAFSSTPEPFRAALKKATWVLINEGRPLRSLQRGGSSTVRWPAAASIRGWVNDCQNFLSFVQEQTPEVTSLSGIIDSTMQAYAQARAGSVAPTAVSTELGAIRFLHDLTADLGPSERLPEPPWLNDAALSPSRSTGGDNATAELPESVLTTLLLWAVAYVEEFAEDIFRAGDAVERYQAPAQDSPLSAKQGRDLIEAWTAAHGATLPYTASSSGGAALGYMCFMLDWPIRFTRGGLDEPTRRRLGVTVTTDSSCPIPGTINGRIHGRTWAPRGLDYYELLSHLRDLQAACMFILGLTTGMRPEELLDLKFGTDLRDGSQVPVTERIESTDGQVRYLLHGRTFKDVRGVDGALYADGVARTWAITELAATCIKTLRHINAPHGRLFATLKSGANGNTQGGPLRSGTAAKQLRAWAARTRDNAQSLGLPREYVLEEGAEEFLTLQTLRRTSQVITQQEIGGVLAGAHQAGHRVADPYATTVTEGYGGITGTTKLGRGRSTERTAEALAHLVTESRTGPIGGPAGARAQSVAQLAAAELELADPDNLMTPLLSKEWGRIAKSVGQSIYEIPLAADAHAYCVFHLPTAACTNEGEAPSVTGCKLSCTNRADVPNSITGYQRRKVELEISKRDATSEEAIRADHLIAAYDDRIAAFNSETKASEDPS